LEEFDLESFLKKRNLTIDRLRPFMHSSLLIENLDMLNQYYDGLTQEIPNWYRKEELERSTKIIKDFSNELIRNFLPIIKNLIIKKYPTILLSENVEPKRIYNKFNLKSPISSKTNLDLQSNFILESSEEKIEKRQLIVLQNPHEETISAFQKVIDNTKSNYVIFLIIDIDISKYILNNQTGSEIEPKLQQEDTINIEGKFSKEDNLKSNLEINRFIKITIRDINILEDILKCIFAWITDIQLLKDKDSIMWFNEGKIKFKANNYQAAIDDFNRAIRLDIKNVEVFYTKINALIMLNKYEEAIEVADKALEIEPTNSRILISKSNVLIKLNKYEEALEVLDKVTSLDPQNTDAWNNKGLTLFKLNKYEEALEVLDKVTSLDPQNADAWNNQTNVFIELGKYDKALYSINEAIRLEPQNVEPWISKSNVLFNLSKYNEAIETVDTAIRLDRTLGDAWALRGSILNKLHKYEDSLQSLNVAARLQPNNANVLNNKGLALLALGEYENALEVFDESLKGNIDTTIQRIIRDFFEGNTYEIIKLIKTEKIEIFNRLRKIGLFSLNLEKTSLRDFNLKNINFDQANFENANLRDSKFDFADFSNANLSNANLTNTTLVATNLSNANLSHSNLYLSIVVETNFSNANLSYANLTNANLQFKDREIYKRYDLIFHANFSESNLNYANLSGAKLSEAIIINPRTYEGLTLNNETDLSKAIIDDSKFIDYLHQYTSNTPPKIHTKKQLREKLNQRDFDEKIINSLLQTSKLPD
jgi:tetratricopeptide (TPR) repeat protein